MKSFRLQSSSLKLEILILLKPGSVVMIPEFKVSWAGTRFVSAGRPQIPSEKRPKVTLGLLAMGMVSWLRATWVKANAAKPE